MNECGEKQLFSLADAKQVASPLLGRFEAIENQKPGTAWYLARMAMEPLAQLHKPERA